MPTGVHQQKIDAPLVEEARQGGCHVPGLLSRISSSIPSYYGGDGCGRRAGAWPLRCHDGSVALVAQPDLPAQVRTVEEGGCLPPAVLDAARTAELRAYMTPSQG